MKADTVSLVERPYQEVVDDILTAIVGGVVNEPIIFDLKKLDYALAQPAIDVRNVTGAVNQERHVFQKEIDYLFSAGDNALVWQQEGTQPDDDTVFYVDYFKTESRSPLTDINVGSVNRTLGEAIGREITTVYQQINRAYLSAFVDTAEGKSLDLVVAILGITRKTKDYAIGAVTFFRDPAITGNITLQDGVQLSTSKAGVFFQTTQPRTLQQGQVRIDAPIRASDDDKGESGEVAAGKITETPQPIAGIARVTNFDATFLGVDDESDEELRLRAKAALRSQGKATIAALIRVIAEERAELVEIWDPNGIPAKQSAAGTTILMVNSEPERFPSLQTRIEQTRAAGVRTTLVARYVYFKPRMVVEIDSGLTAAGNDKIVAEIIAALQNYVDGLSSGDPASGQALLDAAKGVTNVRDVKIVDVIVWRADVAKPGAETLVDAIMTALQGTPLDDMAAVRQRISQTISQDAPALQPTAQRLPDRGLLQTPAGQPVSDEMIESGEFQVSASVDGEPWWVMLEMAAEDVLLLEKED